MKKKNNRNNRISRCNLSSFPPICTLQIHDYSARLNAKAFRYPYAFCSLAPINQKKSDLKKMVPSFSRLAQCQDKSAGHVLACQKLHLHNRYMY